MAAHEDTADGFHEALRRMPEHMHGALFWLHELPSAYPVKVRLWGLVDAVMEVGDLTLAVVDGKVPPEDAVMALISANLIRPPADGGAS